MWRIGGTSITIPELAPLRDDPPFHQRRTYYFTRGKVGPHNGHASNRRLAQSVKKKYRSPWFGSARGRAGRSTEICGLIRWYYELSMVSSPRLYFFVVVVRVVDAFVLTIMFTRLVEFVVFYYKLKREGSGFWGVWYYHFCFYKAVFLYVYIIFIIHFFLVTYRRRSRIRFESLSLLTRFSTIHSPWNCFTNKYLLKNHFWLAICFLLYYVMKRGGASKWPRPLAS